MMKSVKLTAQYINLIIQLENRMHPGNLRLSRNDWVNNFQQMEKSKCNFSWGLFQGQELVGYLIAHLGSTYQEDTEGDAVIVDDVVITPHYKQHLFTLIKSMVEEIDKRINGCPIESLSTPESASMLEKHNDLLGKIGYEIVHTYPLIHENKNFVWMRFEPKG